MKQTMISEIGANEDEMVSNKWYNSTGFTLMGFGVAALGLGLGVGGCLNLAGVKPYQSFPVEITRDLNDNGLDEVYYEISGRKVFLEIDGESIESRLFK